MWFIFSNKAYKLSELLGLSVYIYINLYSPKNMSLKTRSPATARKSRLYRIRPKPSLRFPVTKRKWFVRGETVPCALC